MSRRREGSGIFDGRDRENKGVVEEGKDETEREEDEAFLRRRKSLRTCGLVTDA